uniref:UBA domain-containing protein n=1 Tax=Strigamia maritima TaxID=126957 RepID=T1J4D0_STRMM
MLEGLAAWVLNNYLGQYLENLNTDQLSVGFLQGEVELENIPLRKDALINLDLPVEVRAGFVGKIKLRIPVRRIRSEPWVISIEKLYLVAGPIRPTTYDGPREEQLDQERKIVTADHDAKEEASYYASSYSSWLSYGTSFVANIIENIQVKINDVHLRYEDEITNPNQSFAWGITIESLSVQSANEIWSAKFTSRDVNQVTRKLIELQNLAFYWDTQTTIISDLPLAELAVAMKHLPSGNQQSEDREYVLEPVSARARLTQNCSSQSLRLSAKLWWKFAINAHLNTIRERYVNRNWPEALERARCNILYVQVYTSHLLNPVTLSAQSKAQKDGIEHKLTFEEIRILREIVIEKLHREEEKAKQQNSDVEGNSGTGLLQRWFPLWTGWHSSTPVQPTKTSDFSPDSYPLEEEFLDVLKDTVENNTLLRRDLIFAQLNFHMKRGTFSLLATKLESALGTLCATSDTLNTLFELEFSDVQTCVESRPRSSSFMFSVKLGAMFMRDRVTADSFFPMLVAPHSRDSAYSQKSPYYKLASLSGLTTNPTDEQPLFEFLYERKPFDSTADIKLHIQSQSIDLVYNPSAIQCFLDFFTLGFSARHSELKLTSVAKTRYEELKKQTKFELRKNWNQIIEGDQAFSQKWDVHLDIYAPQIIIPEHFTNANTVLVIFDFGRLQFSNMSAKVFTKPEEIESDDEDFKTPCSSPPNEMSSPESTQYSIIENKEAAVLSTFDLTEILLHKRMYDSYNLELCNLQVLVARMRDNWRFSLLRGSGHMHVLDRFNISVHLERRTVYTSDPQWPNVTLCGSLPKLTVHVNESKVQALCHCINTLTKFSWLSQASGSPVSVVSSYSDTGTIVEDSQPDLTASSMPSEAGLSGDARTDSTETTENSRLLLMQFTIDHMSLEVQSRGRSIAELQVTGVKVMSTKRPFDVSLALTIHGLLLVDAMQTFGSDFELLVASHKHVSMDSVSGSMKDSEPNSPSSPSSPVNSQVPCSPVAIKNALSNLAKENASPAVHRRISPPPSSASPYSPSFVWPALPSDAQDSEALISIEVMFISPQYMPDDKGTELLRIASVQFNNLDIIANQETIIELIGFLKLVLPTNDDDDSSEGSVASLSVSEEEKFYQLQLSSETTTRIELNFDFHRLSVLLMRVVSNKDKSCSARKVATATMSGARIWASLGSTVKIQGSLGGLQVLDLTPEGSVHQKVLSVGHDPIYDRNVDLVSRLHAEVYKNSNSTDKFRFDSDQKAFSFIIAQPETTNTGTPRTINLKKEPAVLDVMLRMASVCYTNSSTFLNELALCVTEFQIYMANLALSIKTAAAEVAFEIVSRGTDALSSSIYAGIYELPLGSGRSTSKSYEHVELLLPEKQSIVGETQIRLDVVLETPVVVFPRTPKGSDILVAQLGQITLQNSHWLDDRNSTPIRGMYDTPATILERITVEIRDINLYSMSVNNNLKFVAESPSRKYSFATSRLHGLYARVSEAKPILHDTCIELLVDRIVWGKSETLQPDLFIGEESVDGNERVQHALNISSKIVTPLKLSLSRQQYEQVLDTLGTLTCVDDPDEVEKKTSDEVLIEEEENEVHPTMSALKLDSILPIEKESRASSFDLNKKAFVWFLGSFEVPNFSVELCGDVYESLVTLSAKDFIVNFKRDNPFVASLQVSLQALVVEDLLQEVGSKHRCLMMSTEPTTGRYNPLAHFKSRYISASCPNMTDHEPVFLIHQSLPDKLQPENLFQSFNKAKERQLFGSSNYRRKSPLSNRDSYPCTPPPSPTAEYSSANSSQDTLVHINLLLVDQKSPEFASKYNSINRIMDIDFNCLQTVVNLQVWVMILDFFSVGGSSSSSAGKNTSCNLSRQSSVTDIRKTMRDQRTAINSEIELQVRSLVLILNKTDCELAKTTVSNVTARMLTKDGDFSVHGKLGSLSIQDLTSHGHIYFDRFTTCGEEALDFQYFSYGDKDPMLMRSYDMRLKIKMSSVRYIHTHRFYSEMTTFFQYFNQLQNLMERFRAAASGANLERDEHGSRILLDVHADTPVILIPQSSSSAKLLVIELGKLTITNCFRFSGNTCNPSPIDLKRMGGHLSSSSCPQIVTCVNKGSPFQSESISPFTPPHVCLLDVMNIDLVDMDFYPAEHLERKVAQTNKQLSDLDFTSFTIRISEDPLLKQKCKLQLQIERNLDSEKSHEVPDIIVRGLLSTIHCSLDLPRYKLVRGLLDFNFGENLEDVERSMPYYPIQTSVPQFASVGEVWICTSFNIDLENVTLELLQSKARSPEEAESSLAKVDFLKCRFIYERYSDSFKNIDLVSQEILISDTRFQDSPVNSRPNVFVNILQPIISSSQKNVLQAEFHYRATRDFTRFTILLNTMRVMAIFDWWKTIYAFMMSTPEQPATSGNPIKSARRQIISSQYLNPLTVSTGILTKRAPLMDKIDVPMELKVNITDTEIVVVEDASLWDTNSVILKSTAVISYRPIICEKPLSCSLQSLEVFSCILGLEEDTALSIIDPVTVNIDLNGKVQSTPTGGLLDATTMDVIHTLEISMHTLSVRLSYHDIQMFLQIIDSIPRQANVSLKKEAERKAWPVNVLEANVGKLEDLGFQRSDCIAAYEASNGQLNEAALWLTQHAIAATSTRFQVGADDSKDDYSASCIHLGSLELRVACFCLCLIDDCKDADVPLIELTLSGLYIQQNLNLSYDALSSFVLSSDYYNRNLSGWEPFLEPWRCQINWAVTIPTTGNNPKLQLQIEAKDVLNVNVTSALIELYKIVKTNWTEDYYKTSGRDRRRSPFVPFALKNETGCVLWFTTFTTTPNKLASMECDSASMKEEKFIWTEVQSGTVVPFIFEGRGKLRHRDTHELRIHQLLVRVDGWQPVTPVSVDKVGIFFRHAKPQINRTASVFAEVPPARVVFAVTLEGGAQKLVTVRSALLLCNRLEETIEVKLETSLIQSGSPRSLFILPSQIIPIPLPCVFSYMWVRPVEFWSVGFCNRPLTWQNVTDLGNFSGDIHLCPANSSREFLNSYRFCVCIKREKFPPDKTIPPPGTANNLTPHFVQPAHTITLLPPVVLVNLLPYDLTYEICKMPIKGCVNSGRETTIHTVDVTNTLHLKLSFENFNECEPLVITPGSSNYVLYMQMYDTSKRLLLLRVKVLLRKGVSLKLMVSAPYWLVNKSGLPLIFRQDGAQVDAAGQFDEHEMARSVAPLLFSFADRDAPPMCIIRIGTSVHLDGHANWCHRFHLEKGVSVRRLRVSYYDNRPDRVYNIGIDVRVGIGRYRETHIVTLSPRFQLDNRTSYKLEFAQKHATINEKENRFHLSSTPNCTLPFHWPRLDLDLFLCVRRTDLANSHWSGGFPIEKIDSFHINMRDEHGKSQFLRVDIALQGATYFVVFTNADKMPAPYRIDNLSEVPITYYQSGVPEERLRTCVRAHSSHPYAWDEPTLQQFITCCAPGGSSAVYDLNNLGDGKQLTYENFIYIAFTHTFNEEYSAVDSTSDSKNKELVLDVPFGDRVFLCQKEPGKRSQLWRMTSTGLLQHEGSSPPRDPRKRSINNNFLTLDIADLSTQSNGLTPLSLRKVDARRRATQTWKFTDEGCLCCEWNSYYVQVPIGRLYAGVEVYLGSKCAGRADGKSVLIPPEQAIYRQRLWPGSGMLSVKVVADGPTRALQIADIRNKGTITMTTQHSDWVVIEESKITKISLEEENNSVNKTTWNLHVSLLMKNGIGLSLVNSIPEELIYFTFTNILIDYTRTQKGQTLDGSIENIKMDNELNDADISVVLFVSPLAKYDNQRFLPAIHFTAHLLPNQNLNAEIFKHLMITVKNLTIQVEEKVLWKLFQFAGFNRSDRELEKIEESDFDNQKTIMAATLANAKRYYFATLKLVLNQVRLSMHTTSHLPADLQAIKHKMGFTFVKFEDAPVELDSFLRIHPFESGQFLIDSILEHYKEELKGQAAKILGSVDFIGNPLGLVNDFSEGLSGFINEGNVGGLLKNVTHGLSNSAAKMAGALSDGLGRVSLDDKHERVRKKIWHEHKGRSSDQLVAGMKGLAYGILGGMTSIVSQTYEGAASEGVPGFFSGLGKGLVGTVAKPAVGVLDFAAGAASAVRDTSRSSTHDVPLTTRLPRVCIGLGELLPRYSNQNSHGQRNLYILNKKDYSELFIAYEQLLSVNEDLRVLISSRRVFFLKRDEPSINNVVLNVEHSELHRCKPVTIEDHGITLYYLELTIKVKSRITGASSMDTLKSPKVRCDTEAIMLKVCYLITIVKNRPFNHPFPLVQVNMFDYFKSIQSHMDFDGQQRAERIFQIIVILFAMAGLGWGYICQQFSQTVYILGAGFALSCILTLPPWPMYRRKPLKWQKCATTEENADTASHKNTNKKKTNSFLMNKRHFSLRSLVTAPQPHYRHPSEIELLLSGPIEPVINTLKLRSVNFPPHYYLRPSFRHYNCRRMNMGQKVSGGIKTVNRENTNNYRPLLTKELAVSHDMDRPSRLDILLDMPPSSRDNQLKHSWNPNDRSLNIFVKDEDKLTFHRHPVAQSTDCIRGRVGYTRGLHIWEIHWSSRQRGTHAVVGVATGEAPLHSVGYQSLVGSNSDSWGWDLGRNKLYHDVKNNPGVSYPNLLNSEETFVVPDAFLVVLDMDEGTLSFVVAGQYLGVAFRSLKGKKLYPIVSAVWGHCEITMKYIGGLDPEPLPLKDLCRRVIRQKVGKYRLEKIEELNLPNSLKSYLLFQDRR